MKKIYLSFIILHASVVIYAQPCHPGVGNANLDINNVNAKILNVGDLWMDLQAAGATAAYEVPKGSGVSALFTSGLWIGGIDAGGALHTSAMTYRQSGNDYWPGPLDTATVSTNVDVCNQYDRIWKVDRKMVADFRIHYKDSGYVIPKDILEWPGNGDVTKGQAKNLAPYIDVNSDGFYNPHDGDYPAYNFTGAASCNGNYLLGDQTLWWIFNDVGNVHTETMGQTLGVEIQAQAFAFKSLNDIDNTTFYQYKIINRSSSIYNNVYIGHFVDPDIGYMFDDYVGCDAGRGLGYCYNGEAVDPAGFGSKGYGEHPPAVGIDFLGGPKIDPTDVSQNGLQQGKDFAGTSFVDSSGRIRMTKFIFYNTNDQINDPTVRGEPSIAQDYYNYLSGYWKDRTPMTYGGNAYGGTKQCDFMFPGDSDTSGIGTGGSAQKEWSEITVGNAPYDRRFLMSAGPFTMQPGSEQVVTVAAVWARDPYGNNIDAIKKLKAADDKIQAFYDHCFDTTFICNMPRASINQKANQLVVNYSCPVNIASSYTWYFGDGATSNQQNPSHTYANPGRYTVSLKIGYPCGSDSTAQIITVYKSDYPLGVELERMEGQGNGGWALDMLKESEDSALISNRVLHPIYSSLRGPVWIDVLDSSLLPKGILAVQFSDTSKNANWKIFKYGNSGLSGDTIYSSSTITIGNYQVIPQWGLAVQAKYCNDAGSGTSDDHNGFLEASMEFADNAKNWLSGVADKDTSRDDNWIRSGTENTFPYSDYSGVDNDQDYEKVLGGTWAPYRLCASSNLSQKVFAGPGWDKVPLDWANQMKKTLASVDIVITADKSKWTRCPVLELQDETGFAEGGAGKLDLRKSPSVDSYGNKGDGVTISSNPNDPGYIAPTGMGWFPGYAINLETGERLNMAFGEDSGLPLENGRDMIWNPTSNEWSLPSYQALFGGKHYIYVFAHVADQKFLSTDSYLPDGPKNIPRYDGGKAIWQLLNIVNSSASASLYANYKKVVFGDAMWVNIPLLAAGHQLLETDVKIKLRVERKYKYGLSGLWGSALVSIKHDAPFDTIAIPQNRNFPLYNFNTNKIVSGVENLNASIADVSAFPNPFESSVTFAIANPKDLGKPYHLSIYDITGKRVRNYENINQKLFIVQRGDLVSGIYFYNVTTQEGKSKIGKLVIE